jgi:RDD family
MGFFLALPYFAILNSRVGNGQTLGKRWMHLQVVDRDGTPVSLWRSSCRYFVLSVPYFLDDLTLPVTRVPWIVSSLLGLVVFVVGGATLYLVLFNRRTRQGVHDLAGRTYVADAYEIGSLQLQPVWKMHFVILGILLLALCLGTGVLGDKLANWAPFPQMLEDVRLVEGMQDVQSAGEQERVSSGWSGENKRKTLVVTVSWSGQPDGREVFADQVARVILQHNPKVKEHDSLRIVLIRGFDLGIAHAQITYPFERTPDQWSSRLFGTTLPPTSSSATF